MSELMSESVRQAEGADVTRTGLYVVPDPVPAPRPLGEGVPGLMDTDPGLDQELVCRHRVQVTHDVVTLVLQPTTDDPVRFVPGQFL